MAGVAGGRINELRPLPNVASHEVGTQRVGDPSGEFIIANLSFQRKIHGVYEPFGIRVKPVHDAQFRDVVGVAGKLWMHASTLRSVLIIGRYVAALDRLPFFTALLRFGV